ncbi:hypothetical protein VE25_14875 [Devosia geojensis]|uniref:Uncharacterized protein n=1 Tax=Devosia geojensis TaxID=443610 RepID=A0A0F5FQD8_9HYPH|nr:hypothetical protein VE25_14875 [Devosia geojensis]
MEDVRFQPGKLAQDAGIETVTAETEGERTHRHVAPDRAVLREMPIGAADDGDIGAKVRQSLSETRDRVVKAAGRPGKGGGIVDYLHEPPHERLYHQGPTLRANPKKASGLTQRSP